MLSLRLPLVLLQRLTSTTSTVQNVLGMCTILYIYRQLNKKISLNSGNFIPSNNISHFFTGSIYDLV